MKRKDGCRRSDYQQDIDSMIIDLLKTKPYTIHRIRKMLNEAYERKYCWLTIHRHIQELINEGVVDVFYESKDGLKKIVVYKIKKH